MYTISRDNFVYTISRDNFVYTICVMVKDKRMIILYVIISCDQPLFTLYFSVWEIFLSLSLSLYPFHLSLSLSYHSFPLYISPSTLLLLSLFSLSFSLAYLMDVFVLIFFALCCMSLELIRNFTSFMHKIYMIEQKGMTFDHDFCYSFPLFLPS